MKTIIKSRWNDIMQHVVDELNVTDVSFKTWLKPLSVYEVKDNVVIISAGDGIFDENIEHIRRRYGASIRVAIAEITNLQYEVEFYTLASLESKKTNNPLSYSNMSGSSGNMSFLNPRYTFDTFISSANSSLAFSAALAVAESPAVNYNPLFIYGDVGLGKTHLMHSIAHEIIRTHPSYKVLYVTSEFFTNEVIQSIRYGKQSPEELRKKYRSLDVLLIDDIQFVIGKESTQEEFFHTFNALYESKKQIVISSDKPPKDIPTLESRLRSRFEWGLIVDIQPPSYETRMAILKKKSEIDGLDINEEILSYIANNVTSNIRELEGSLTRISAMSRLQKQEITLALAMEALKDIISPDSKKVVTIDLILEVVAEHYSITTAELLSNNRSRNIAFPRQVSMYLAKKLTPLSLNEIGDHLGKRDHSTIIHGLDKISSQVVDDVSLQNTLDVLTKKICPHI